MQNALHPDHMTAAQRLGEVAQLLAEGLLRHRLRELRASRVPRISPENRLAVSPPASTHVFETSRSGERP